MAKVSETDFGFIPVFLNKWQFLCTYNIHETLWCLSCCRLYSTAKQTVRGKRCHVLSRLGACSVLLIFFSSLQNPKPFPRTLTSPSPPATSAPLGCWLQRAGVVCLLSLLNIMHFDQKNQPNGLYSVLVKQVSSAASDFQALDERGEIGYIS